jgi:hypothetical protein
MEHTEQLHDEDSIRLEKLRELRELIGSGIWEGDLAEMREDQPPTAHSQSTTE